jgi:hypothetical protein
MPQPMSDADVRLMRTMVMAIEILADRLEVQSFRGVTTQQLLSAVTSTSVEDEFRDLRIMLGSVGTATPDASSSAATLHDLLKQCLGRTLDDGRHIESRFTTLTAEPEWMVFPRPHVASGPAETEARAVR